MIELRSSTSDVVGVVQPINPRTVRIVQREAVFDPMRPAGADFDDVPDATVQRLGLLSQ